MNWLQEQAQKGYEWNYIIFKSLLNTTFDITTNMLIRSTFFFLINLLNPTGHVMHQLFNIQQLYALPTLYLYVSYLSENKQRLVPLTA